MKKAYEKTIEENFYYDFKISKTYHRILFLILLLSSIAYLIFIIVESFNKNGYFSFPLDDPWIHLQFAKNLNEFGTFSYYKNLMVTSGSTAPLYTFLLALLFSFSNSEFIISYFLGIVFFIGSIIYFFLILKLEFKNSILISLFGTILFAFMWKLQWAALSGMETTTAIFFLLGTIYFFKMKNWIVASAFAGFFVWVRPEAMILLVALILDILYKKYWFKEKIADKNFKIGILILSVLYFSYFVFNYSLSGFFFPNTFSAKIKYYSGGKVNYLQELFQLFTENELILLSLFAVIALLFILLSVFKRKNNTFMVFALWIIGMVSAYGFFLPYLYQKGRYLFPVFPAYLILGIYGIMLVTNYLHKNFKYFKDLKRYRTLLVVIVFVISIQFLYASMKLKNIYIEDVKYIYDRQIKTAKWINENLPEKSIIATHDIGAIAYYSNRRVVDMVGLVSPEMIPNIGSFAKLKNFLDSKHVTHVATLRNWFHIGNQNPLFTTNQEIPEVMEVFEYTKNSEFVPQDIVRINEEAEYLIKLGDLQRALLLLNQSLNFYPELDWTHYLIGKIFFMIKDREKANMFLGNVLKLNPNHIQAKQILENLK